MQKENGMNKQCSPYNGELTSIINFPCILDVVSLSLFKYDCAGDGDGGIVSGLTCPFFEGILSNWMDACDGDHIPLAPAVK
jgi:hypothetical protein